MNIAQDVQDQCYENYNTSLTLCKVQISGQTPYWIGRLKTVKSTLPPQLI